MTSQFTNGGCSVESTLVSRLLPFSFWSGGETDQDDLVTDYNKAPRLPKRFTMTNQSVQTTEQTQPSSADGKDFHYETEPS